MKLIPTLFTLSIAVWLFSPLAQAHGDENHDAAPTATAIEGAPRIVAHSDLFELVGIVENGAMTLYLDRYADNSPVTDANIEVEAGAEKAVATVNANGTYSFASKLFSKPSVLPITFTISAGSDTDLLAGDLVIADEHATDTHDAAKPFANKWLIGALIIAATLTLIAGLLIRKRRHQKAGMFK